MDEIFLDIHEIVDRTSPDPKKHETRIQCNMGAGMIDPPLRTYFPADFDEARIADSLERNAMLLEDEISPFDPQKWDVIKLYNMTAQELRKG